MGRKKQNLSSFNEGNEQSFSTFVPAYEPSEIWRCAVFFAGTKNERNHVTADYLTIMSIVFDARVINK